MSNLILTFIFILGIRCFLHLDIAGTLCLEHVFELMDYWLHKFGLADILT